MARILDQYGNAIDTGTLTETLATPELTGVRQLWQGSVAGGLTPEALVSLLEASVHHSPREYLTLAEEMEERDAHYFSVLGTRKLAVESIDVVVESATDDARDVRLADAVRDLFNLECVQQSRADLLDALGKSFAVSEIIWDRSARQWQPQAITRVDQRWFTFDRLTGQELRLLDAADAFNGIALPPYKFICHQPRLKSGLPIRNGLARIVGFAWLCKAYALKDWMAFAEVFGMPVRVGTYSGNADPKDVRVLRRAVANIGTDAACVIPESMKIEFIEAGNRSGGADLFQRLCDYLDRQISKAVLGQTMSTDAQATGMNSGNAEIHNEVRADLRDADSQQLALTYQRDLVRPFIDLNFGPQKRYPKVIIRKRKAEDVRLLAEVLSHLVPLGLEVEQSVIRDKLSLPDPDPKGKLLRAPQAVPDFTAINHAPTLPRLALNAQQANPDYLDVLAEKMAARGDAAVEDWAQRIQSEAMQASGYDDLLGRLSVLLTDLPLDELGSVLERGFTTASLAGQADAQGGDQGDGRA